MNAMAYKRGNRFSDRTTLADAAVEWQALSHEQEALVVIDNGMPYLAGVESLSERAEALLEAAERGDINGLTHNEDGYPLSPAQIRLDRDSVARWIAAVQVRMQTAQPVVATPDNEERLLTQDEVLEKLGMSASTLHRMVKAGKFSQAHLTGPKRWKLSYINSYLTATG